MLTSPELHELVRELDGKRVLSVYLDTRVTDPAMRNAWRPALVSAIRAARATLTSDDELAEFDRAAAFLEEPDQPPGGVWGSPGWVAFATADGTRYQADLPVTTTTLAAWRDGPLVWPYLRALKQHRAVVVALVESRMVRLFRYARRELQPVEEMRVPAVSEPSASKAASPGPRGSAYPAPRAAVATEAAHRRRLAAFQRLLPSLGARIADLAGDDGWVLIGGTQEWARIVGSNLPRQLEGRAMVTGSLDHEASDAEIAQAAKRAASELRSAHGGALVDRLVERAGGNGRAAAGVPAVQRALGAQAVDLLLISPDFIRENDREAEDAIRAAIAQGADVEVLSTSAAEHLARTGEGIAARLRFAPAAASMG
jgi:hypothetical protein